VEEDGAPNLSQNSFGYDFIGNNNISDSSNRSDYNISDRSNRSRNRSN
jgi:hypothetical protein